MTKKLLNYILPMVQVLTLILVVALILGNKSISLGGTTNFDQLDTADGYLVDGTSVINGSGVFVGAVNTGANTLTIGSSGTAINQYKCYTNTSFDPGSVSSSTAAEALAFLTPSVNAGDIIIPSLASVTSTNLWRLDAKVTAGSGTANATTTLYLYGVEGAAVNLSTTTAKICIIN